MDLLVEPEDDGLVWICGLLDRPKATFNYRKRSERSKHTPFSLLDSLSSLLLLSFSFQVHQMNILAVEMVLS